MAARFSIKIFTMKKTAVFCSAILACALVACAAILVNPSVVFRSAGGIKVKGTAVERVQSDAAEWGARICTRAPDLRAAAAEAEKFAALAKAEFEKRSVRRAEFSAVFASPVYKVEKGAVTNVVEGYSAALSISVSAKSREEIANVEAACSGLLKSGVPIFPEEARYYYTGLESLKMRLLEAAAQNARKRAEKLVSGSGSKLGAVVSASQGIFQITRPLSNETSDWGMYDTSSFEKDVKCVVTIEFSAADGRSD